MHVRRSLVMACLSGSLVVAGVALASDKAEDAAQAAAESWLKTVDAGNYSASWDQGAATLKGAVKQAEWVQMLGGQRTPLGKVVSRRLRSRQLTDKAPTTRVVGGKVYTFGQRGKFVIIEYDTTFLNKPSAVETVTPMADPDGVWRVSGYSVR